MGDAEFERLLIVEDDLEESFFGEEPSAAYNPAFVDGDESGRVVVDMTNTLTHGTHPDTKHFASALYTNVMGSVVFHHLTQFSGDACQRVYREFTDALRQCGNYRMQLNDGAEYDITKTGIEPLDGDVDGVVVRWLSTAGPYRIEGSWAILMKDDVLSYINTRIPDKNEIYRLARISVDRISKTVGS